MARRKARERRRRLLYALAAGAIISLAVATLSSSVVWLGVTLVFDLAIAAYVGLLVQLRQRAAPAPVVPISQAAAVDAEPAQHTVRVVAG